MPFPSLECALSTNIQIINAGRAVNLNATSNFLDVSNALKTHISPMPTPPLVVGNIPQLPVSKSAIRKLGSRKMTQDVEKEVLARWGEKVEEYLRSVRRQVFKDITLALNSSVHQRVIIYFSSISYKTSFMRLRNIWGWLTSCRRWKLQKYSKLNGSKVQIQDTRER